MKKIHYELTILALSLTVYFPILGCRTNIKQQTETVKINNGNAVPLAWISENEIVISAESKLIMYDISHNKIISEIAEGFDESNLNGSNCFSPERGIISLTSNKITGEKVKSSAQNPSARNYYSIANWGNPLEQTKIDHAIWWNTNPLDCTQYDYKKRKEYSELLKNLGSVPNVRQFSPLLKSKHGESYLIVNKLEDKSFIEYLEVHKINDNQKDIDISSLSTVRIKLEYNGLPHGNERFALLLRSYYDVTNKDYLIYETTDEFDAKAKTWPLTAWRISPNLEIIDTYILPPGPWVEKHSFLKQLSCFSCGCSCYSHMELRGNGGKIYAHIWGKAVDDDHAGIYRLKRIDNEEEKWAWEHLYAGNFNNEIIVSPDGCKILFANEEKILKKMNVCMLVN